MVLLVRAQSVKKPIVCELKNAGAQIRIGDVTESPERLQSILQGVDILISLVLVSQTDQKPLLLAAKQAGVGRGCSF